MSGDLPVHPVAGRSKQGEMAIAPGERAEARYIPQRLENGQCAARTNAVAVDILHGMAELLDRDFRMLRGGFLIRDGPSAPSGEDFPSLDALPAEPAIAVVNQLTGHSRHG